MIGADGNLIKEESEVCLEGDAHIKLLQRLLELQPVIDKVSETYIPMEHLSKKDRMERLKKQRYRCHHCHLQFKRSDKIVLDHHHLTGETHGLSHNHCNLNRATKKKVAMFALNAR